jgi:hypothetical protein
MVLVVVIVLGTEPRRIKATVSAPVQHHHRVVSHQFLRADIQMRVGHGGDTDDVGFPDPLEKTGDDLVEVSDSG